MDMEMMDPYRRPYSSLPIQTYGDQQHGQQHPQQYPYWNHHLMAFYQQHQRAAVTMIGQGNMHASKQTEPKPRLAKDEVELLEREFLKNPKPNSSTKRELAEQMGVEVPRINNWFQNRRAKEKQMKKTAEFEAQQARERAASETKSSDDQGQGTISEFYGLSNHHQSLGLSTATFGEDEEEDDEDDDTGTGDANLDRHSHSFCDPVDHPTLPPIAGGNSTPTSSDSDGFVHIDYEPSSPHPLHAHGLPQLAPPAAISSSFALTPHQPEFRGPSYAYGLSEPIDMASFREPCYDDVPSHAGILRDSGPFHLFPDRDYFSSPPLPQFPSELIAENAARSNEHESPSHQELTEDVIKEENLSPSAIPDSPPSVSQMRFKSPPPSADIASRRNMQRPAPLGLTSLRSASHCPGPKTAFDAPRRADTASPLRRISSATGSLSGRVQKAMLAGGPRSPFSLDRNKEVLYQSLQGAHSPMMASLNSAMSPPLASDGMGGQEQRENTVTTNASSDEEHGYTYGSMGSINGLHMYKSEPTIKTPPGTPGLPIGFQDSCYPSSVDQAWNYVPHDEPLPTPSLCSHGGSELEFSMAPQMPGYVASQPPTPSFPPSVGPTYTSFFTSNLPSNLANSEYNFPDSYRPESSARSSPGGPPRSKQFQFAQNVTPQDFSTDK
ncbi:hypothetical protein B0T26DRAFT_744457 [Lasiosphaeria miniovina]|uniref:Homeobox domain-containing protein n=1 Tax=Lasiosphaeria miniovina TaxID=1954250 RepID=A0AA39ZUI0_9PEZI|nr:uncharacterized protein B0T26DRAFT_744457 [Lasiosphaeria miniovina]KAK0703765.1 hypothetical protein B0T26DRAFT_744457 [Lasiosphaeria miniovina]